MEKRIFNPVPRIEALSVKNYRVLRNLELKGLTPFTVFLGPNGSGKSTLFDVFAFLSECFSVGLRKTWDKRGRFKELRSRNSDSPIEIELKYREKPKSPLIAYHLSIDENKTGPYIKKEWLRWRRTWPAAPFKFLNFENGSGQVISGEMPDDKSEERIEEKLNSPEMLAVSALGQLARHPRVAALRKFITSWYLSYITADNTRTTPDEGPQEQLSKTGDNLPNVIQYFQEGHLNILGKIFSILSERVPKLERVESVPMPDGRLLLQFKDYPFDKPILSKFTSDGTLKMLAYLTVLYNPDPPQLIGIEEPENQIHPKLLSDLAEECKEATAKTQIFISTHSPYFVDAVKPKELWVLDRDDNGYTIAKKVSDMQGIIQFYEKGSSTGQLWMENFFELGDPFKSSKR